MADEKKSNIFGLLGIEQTEDFAIVKRAYLKLALKLHPDKNLNQSSEDVKKYKILNSEWNKLNTKEKFQQYLAALVSPQRNAFSGRNGNSSQTAFYEERAPKYHEEKDAMQQFKEESQINIFVPIQFSASDHEYDHIYNIKKGEYKTGLDYQKIYAVLKHLLLNRGNMQIGLTQEEAIETVSQHSVWHYHLIVEVSVSIRDLSDAKFSELELAGSGLLSAGRKAFFMLHKDARFNSSDILSISRTNFHSYGCATIRCKDWSHVGKINNYFPEQHIDYPKGKSIDYPECKSEETPDAITNETSIAGIVDEQPPAQAVSPSSNLPAPVLANLESLKNNLDEQSPAQAVSPSNNLPASVSANLVDLKSDLDEQSPAQAISPSNNLPAFVLANLVDLKSDLYSAMEKGYLDLEQINSIYDLADNQAKMVYTGSCTEAKANTVVKNKVVECFQPSIKDTQEKVLGRQHIIGRVSQVLAAAAIGAIATTMVATFFFAPALPLLFLGIVGIMTLSASESSIMFGYLIGSAVNSSIKDAGIKEINTEKDGIISKHIGEVGLFKLVSDNTKVFVDTAGSSQFGNANAG